MKGFTKSPFGNKGGAAPLPQHDIENPFEDEEVLEEIVSHQGSSSASHGRDPYSSHHADDEDLHLDDYVDEPPPPPKKKKPAAKKKKALQPSSTELTAPPQYSQAASPTSFGLPPSSSEVSAPATSGTAAASAHAKKYLNNVTTYFNDKREQFKAGRGGATAGDPEVSGTMDDLALREAALKRREAEILAQEQKVAERERQVKQFEGKVNNWPFRWWAILYHNIPDDILPENQRFIRSFYYLWMFELFCFAWQFVAVVTDVLDGSCSASILTIVWNALFCCAGLFGSWFLWYKVIYDASKKSAISSIKYGRFTCGFFSHWAWTIIMLSGVWASDGILGLLQTVSGGCTASSIFFGIGTVAWGMNLLWSSYMSKLAYSKYKASGGTLSSMTSDFTKEAAKAALSRS